MKSKHHITFGLKDKEIVHVDCVPNGIGCGCVCSKCRESLVAKNRGKIKNHHFAHASGVDCAGGYETMLHQMAKKVLSESNHIILPEIETDIEILSVRFQEKFLFKRNYYCRREFTFLNVKLEEKNDDIIPDITIISKDGSILLIEIFVTHGVDEEKFNKLREMKLPTIEIDLSDFEPTSDSLNRLKKLLIEEWDKKRWVFPPQQSGQALNRFIRRFRIASMHDWFSFCPLKEEIGKRKYTESIPCDSCEYKLKPTDLHKQHGITEIYCIGECQTIGFPVLNSRLLEEIHQIIDELVSPYGIYDRKASYKEYVKRLPCPKCGYQLKANTKISNWSVFCRQCHYDEHF